MTTTQLHQLYLWLIGLLLAVGGFLWFRASERHAGAIAVLTHQADSTAHVLAKQVDSTSRVALQAASQAQAQKAQALRLVAAGEALRAKQDSTMRASSAERLRATKMVADSLATLAQLRDEIGRLVRLGGRDSTSNAEQHAIDQRSIHGLLATVHADSLALTAEQRRSQSLQALTETLTREVTLLKKSQPSMFGNVVRVVGWAGAGFVLGRALK